MAARVLIAGTSTVHVVAGVATKGGRERGVQELAGLARGQRTLGGTEWGGHISEASRVHRTMALTCTNVGPVQCQLTSIVHAN